MANKCEVYDKAWTQQPSCWFRWTCLQCSYNHVVDSMYDDLFDITNDDLDMFVNDSGEDYDDVMSDDDKRDVLWLDYVFYYVFFN